jgi:hypothetical protein
MLIKNTEEPRKMDVDPPPPVPDWVSTNILKMNSLVEDIAIEPLVEYEYDTLMMNKSTYNKSTRKLNNHRAKLKGKKLQETCTIELYVGIIDTIDAFKMYMSIGEILSHSLEDQRRENYRLTCKVEDLKYVLTLKPLFVHPLSTMKPVEVSPTLLRRIDKTYGLFQSLEAFFACNVKKRIEIVKEIFEIVSQGLKLSDRLKNVIQIVDNEIQQDIEMNEKVTNILFVYVDQLVDFPRQKEGLPLEMRMKQIKVGWNQRIDVLRSCRERLDILSYE